jgi:hypothetical protein
MLSSAMMLLSWVFFPDAKLKKKKKVFFSKVITGRLIAEFGVVNVLAALQKKKKNQFFVFFFFKKKQTKQTKFIDFIYSSACVYYIF